MFFSHNSVKTLFKFVRNFISSKKYFQDFQQKKTKLLSVMTSFLSSFGRMVGFSGASWGLEAGWAVFRVQALGLIL